MINAALVSAQNRKRLFWVGKLNAQGTYDQVHIKQPEDRNIMLKDILLDGETEDLKSLCITGIYHKKNEQNFLQKRDGQMIFREATKKGYALIEEGDSVDISFPQSKTRRGRVGKKVKNLMTSQNITVYRGGSCANCIQSSANACKEYQITTHKESATRSDIRLLETLSMSM